MDLISRKVATEEFEEMVTSVSVYGESAEAKYATNARLRFIEKLNSIPTVPAVPLDKLCNLLSQHLGKIRCNDCWVACSDPCPGTADDWRRVVTKWMEGQQNE